MTSYGWVKMIYIGRPYNTGKDFIYPDNYADPLGQGRDSLRQDRLIVKQPLGPAGGLLLNFS